NSSLARSSCEKWVRVNSEQVSQLFPKLSFFSISLAFDFEKTVGINTDTGKIEEELWSFGNHEEFGKMLVKYKIVLKDDADANKIWKAYCEIHHDHEEELPFKKVSDTKWHLGIASYDQTISATETRTVVTTTH